MTRSDRLLLIFMIVVTIILWFVPSGFERTIDYKTVRVKAQIIDTDDSNVVQTGIIKSGTQRTTIKVLNGRFKNDTLIADNVLTGRMEFDKYFVPEDKALVVLNLSKDKKEVVSATLVDHYRLNIELILLVLFAGFLILYARGTGLKAIVSFIFAGLLIWKILLPGYLKGHSPILLSLVIVTLLTAGIIYLVAGINKKGHTAFAGSFAGIIITGVLAIFFGHLFKVHGAIKPFSETLLYSGFAHLNLTSIFLAGIFISSSGAVMDIAMDIAAAQDELRSQQPDISTKALIKSGFSVGRAVVGTMTTTLLLAYSGGFSALLMVFIAQGTPTVNILNLNYVAGEILHTMVGSFGLIMVAPFTAIAGGFIMGNRDE
ncbi:YibE/F family protein [Puteibacter caeruleilacunae]|nr:YibE/F family protein [Puteibacter caeruleilacunae]